ncbi:MAG: phage holin family protein [Thermodesulfobacteriota bacterium]
MSNLNRIVSLALKPGNEYVRAMLTRLVILGAFLVIAFILVILGIGFLVWSSYLYLNTVVNPYLAALLSGLIAIVLAGALVLIGSMISKSPGTKETKDSGQSKANFVDSTEVIEQYPLESGLMAMAAGFIAGSSPESRKVLTELFVSLNQNSSE